MGVLELAGEQSRYEPVNAVERLRTAIESWKQAIDIEGLLPDGPDRLVMSTQTATVTMHVIMPIVAGMFGGDEHVMCEAAALLRRYVRTSNWYAPFALDSDEESSDDDIIIGSPQPPVPAPRELVESPRTSPDEIMPAAPGTAPPAPMRTRDDDDQEPRRGNVFGSPRPTRPPPQETVRERGLLATDETLDDSDDDMYAEGEGGMSMSFMRALSGGVQNLRMASERDDFAPTAAVPLTTLLIPSVYRELVEAAIVCTRLAGLNVSHSDSTDFFYERLEEMSGQPRFKSFFGLAAGIALDDLGLRERQVLIQLDGRAATQSFFDMWAVFDASMVPAPRVPNVRTAETLRGMASVLISMLQLDNYIAVNRPWVSAAATALLLASMVGRAQDAALTLDAYASLLVEADAAAEWTRDGARQAIAARANYIRESMIELSGRHEEFTHVRRYLVRPEVVVAGHLYTPITDVMVASTVNWLQQVRAYRVDEASSLDAVGSKRARRIQSKSKWRFDVPLDALEVVSGKIAS